MTTISGDTTAAAAVAEREAADQTGRRKVQALTAQLQLENFTAAEVQGAISVVGLDTVAVRSRLTNARRVQQQAQQHASDQAGRRKVQMLTTQLQLEGFAAAEVKGAIGTVGLDESAIRLHLANARRNRDEEGSRKVQALTVELLRENFTTEEVRGAISMMGLDKSAVRNHIIIARARKEEQEPRARTFTTEDQTHMHVLVKPVRLKTSNIKKYTVGQGVLHMGAGDVSGKVIKVIPESPGAKEGPGEIEVQPQPVPPQPPQSAAIANGIGFQTQVQQLDAKFDARLKEEHAERLEGEKQSAQERKTIKEENKRAALERKQAAREREQQQKKLEEHDRKFERVNAQMNAIFAGTFEVFRLFKLEPVENVKKYGCFGKLVPPPPNKWLTKDVWLVPLDELDHEPIFPKARAAGQGFRINLPSDFFEKHAAAIKVAYTTIKVVGKVVTALGVPVNGVIAEAGKYLEPALNKALDAAGKSAQNADDLLKGAAEGGATVVTKRAYNGIKEILDGLEGVQSWQSDMLEYAKIATSGEKPHRIGWVRKENETKWVQGGGRAGLVAVQGSSCEV